MNLQTGYKEAKILEEEKEKTDMVHIENDLKTDDETQQQNPKTDVDIESVRRKLEEALKNIPAQKFDDDTEEKFKEISKKFKSYNEIKQDLKDIELQMQTENEIVKQLIERFIEKTGNDEASNADKLTILEDLTYLSHSIDNSLYLILSGGLENVIIPGLNDTNINIKKATLKALGAILQNNNEAKNYVIEKTNIGNYLISILSKSIDSPKQMSVALFAYGSLMINNHKVSPDLVKKGLTVLIEIISSVKSEIMLTLKTKALVLFDDLLRSKETKDHGDFIRFLGNLRLCKHLENYFSLNRNGLIADIDSSERAIISLTGLKDICHRVWAESPTFRHALLVLLNNLRAQLETSDEDSKSFYIENIERLDEFKKFLYGNLKISEDDLSLKYGDEL
jgi:nucleotide exchange factor SIL1